MVLLAFGTPQGITLELFDGQRVRRSNDCSYLLGKVVGMIALLLDRFPGAGSIASRSHVAMLARKRRHITASVTPKMDAGASPFVQ